MEVSQDWLHSGSIDKKEIKLYHPLALLMPDLKSVYALMADNSQVDIISFKGSLPNKLK